MIYYTTRQVKHEKMKLLAKCVHTCLSCKSGSALLDVLALLSVLDFFQYKIIFQQTWDLEVSEIIMLSFIAGDNPISSAVTNFLIPV